MPGHTEEIADRQDQRQGGTGMLEVVGGVQCVWDTECWWDLVTDEADEQGSPNTVRLSAVPRSWEFISKYGEMKEFKTSACN